MGFIPNELVQFFGLYVGQVLVMVIEAMRCDETILAGRLTDHLRLGLGIRAVGRAYGVRVEMHRMLGCNWDRALLVPGWDMRSLTVRLDAFIGTLSVSESIKSRGSFQATRDLVEVEHALLCEYPEGSGNLVFLTNAQRTRIISEGNSSPDYYILPTDKGGADKEIRTTRRAIVFEWDMVEVEYKYAPIDYTEEDIIF